MDHKIEVAKNILTLANDFDGQVYGGFVRDVIVPRMNDPNCTVSFKDVDIWFQNKLGSAFFIGSLIEKLDIRGKSLYDQDLDYGIKDFKDFRFLRKQYRIYSNNEFLFHIDIITADKLPVNDFYVNTITYKHTKNGFERSAPCYADMRAFTNKIALMLEGYDPVGNNYYERINRIFFSKGWIVRCNNKHKRLFDYIRTQHLDVEEVKDSHFYSYIPKNIKMVTPIIDIDSKLKDVTVISSTEDKPSNLKDATIISAVDISNLNTKDITIIPNTVFGTRVTDTAINIDIISRLDTNEKDILRLIFDKGLDVLEGKLFDSIEDKELQNIYKLGLNEYRTKIETFLK